MLVLLLETLAVLAAVLVVGIVLFHKWSFSRLPNVKGPTPEYFYGTMRSMISNTDEPIGYNLLLLSRKYGKLYDSVLLLPLYPNCWSRVKLFFTSALPAVMVLDPELAREALLKLQLPKNPRFYKTLGQGLIASNGDEWRVRREGFQSFFHVRNLVNVVPTTVSSTLRMLRNLADRKFGPEVDLQTVMSGLTLDVLAKAGFAVDFNSIDEPEGLCAKAQSDYIEQRQKRARDPFYRLKPWAVAKYACHFPYFICGYSSVSWVSCISVVFSFSRPCQCCVSYVLFVQRAARLLRA